jgi:hypothetical protein
LAASTETFDDAGSLRLAARGYHRVLLVVRILAILQESPGERLIRIAAALAGRCVAHRW